MNLASLTAQWKETAAKAALAIPNLDRMAAQDEYIHREDDAIVPVRAAAGVSAAITGDRSGPSVLLGGECDHGGHSPSLTLQQALPLRPGVTPARDEAITQPFLLLEMEDHHDDGENDDEGDNRSEDYDDDIVFSLLRREGRKRNTKQPPPTTTVHKQNRYQRGFTNGSRPEGKEEVGDDECGLGTTTSKGKQQQQQQQQQQQHRFFQELDQRIAQPTGELHRTTTTSNHTNHNGANRNQQSKAPLARPKRSARDTTTSLSSQFEMITTSSSEILLDSEELQQLSAWKRIAPFNNTTSATILSIGQKLWNLIVVEHARESFIGVTFLLGAMAYFWSRRKTMEDDVQ